MKIFFFCILLLLCFINKQVCAQEIGLSVGYGTYSMQDLKLLNKEMTKQQQDVKLQTTSNFPGFAIFSLYTLLPVTNSFQLGGNFCLSSTGSRLAYSDYSGSLHVDQKLSGISLCITPSFFLMHQEKNQLWLDCRIGSILTAHSLEQSVDLNGTRDASVYEFRSVNIFVEPGCRYGRTLGTSPFRISFRVAYNLNAVKGKLVFTENNNAYLQVNGGIAHADWSGIRTEMGFSYLF